MISDLERIGDQAADIAELSAYMEAGGEAVFRHIANMADDAGAMVTSAVESFVKRDTAMADQVIADDDRVDDLFLQVKADLCRRISADTESTAACLDLLMVAKYYERIGDHATNVAEWVKYAITGSHD